jgi:hypothetical protein
LFEHTDWKGDFADSERRAGRIAARVRLDLRSVPLTSAHAGNNAATWCASRALVHLGSESDDTVLLDVADATLADGTSKKSAGDLERLLADGGSGWRVADNRKSLERRVEPTATDAFRQAAAGNPGPHLTAAWTAAYGRHPAPSRAYSEAIKAVETSYIPVVLPRDRLATLGKVIGELRQHSTHWQLAIKAPGGSPADITIVLGMLRLLWEGQTDRHGGGTPAVPITAPAAEAAVHLAVSLVQWSESGAFQRVDKS